MSVSINPLPSGIYGITDPALLPGDRLFSGVKQALEGGCKVIQYRDKETSFKQCVANAQRLKTLCNEFSVPLIINDSLELAVASDADGLHLGKSDGKLSEARTMLGANKIIGVTCHSDLSYAQDCIEQGASYCAFGRFFDSKTKPQAPPCPLSLLREALLLDVPVVAIGGINIDNIPRFGDTPPHNIAVINSLFGQDDIFQAAKRLSDEFTRIQSN
jgi:thiamine-phosphate pyrophosphorylase